MTSLVGRIVCTLIATACLAVPQAHAQNANAVPGEYCLSGVREVGSCMRLSPGGKWEYFLSYGAYDERSEGTWDYGITVTVHLIDSTAAHAIIHRMARLARVVVPGHPHHVTQRGNGRARTFFGDADYALYRDLLAEHCRAADVAVWAWCLMPNHMHLILVPSDADGLRRALASAFSGRVGTGRPPGNRAKLKQRAFGRKTGTHFC